MSMRILDEATYYWVYSAHGPTDSGHYYNRTFIKGMVPCPLPGDSAGKLEAVGFHLVPYEPGTWFAGWEKPDPADFRQRPVFAPICVSADPAPMAYTLETVQPDPEFPPAVLPERLPDSWVEFFEKYTAGGKLKKEHRGS